MCYEALLSKEFFSICQLVGILHSEDYVQDDNRSGRLPYIGSVLEALGWYDSTSRD